MSDAALKNIIRCKLELAHAMIDLLPETLQESLRNSEKEILRIFSEVVDDYLKQVQDSEDTSVKEKKLKAIEIQ